MIGRGRLRTGQTHHGPGTWDRGLLVLVVLLTFVPAPARAQRPDVELKGITVVGVVIEDLSSQSVACGLNRESIQAMIHLANKPPVVVIAPDRRREGTNGLLVSPAGLIDYEYGPESSVRHAERGARAGAGVEIVRSKAIGLDLDLPEDLDLLGGLKGLKLE